MTQNAAAVSPMNFRLLDEIPGAFSTLYSAYKSVISPTVFRRGWELPRLALHDGGHAQSQRMIPLAFTQSAALIPHL